jgi:hypothetical protein
MPIPAHRGYTQKNNVPAETDVTADLTNEVVEVKFADGEDPATRNEQWITYEPATEGLKNYCPEPQDTYLGPKVKPTKEGLMVPASTIDHVGETNVTLGGSLFRIPAISEVMGGKIGSPQKQILCINKTLFGEHEYLRKAEE